MTYLKLSQVLLIFGILLTSDIVLGQKNNFNTVKGREFYLEEVIIKKGEVAVLTEHPPPVKRLIIQGTLIAPEKDINLYVEQLIIDGGKLQVGSRYQEHRSYFSVLLRTKDIMNPAKVIIKNNGSILLYGSSNALAPKKMDRFSEGHKVAHLIRNITIRPEQKQSKGYVQIDDAKNVQISGVHFKELGTATLPALQWRGLTEEPGFIQNSVFSLSKNVDVCLNETSIALEQNTFVSRADSSIHCAKSGKGTENNIEGNHIENTNVKGRYAIVIGNPYQSITNNTITVGERARGIHLQKNGFNHEIPETEELNSLFSIAGNVIKRNIIKTANLDTSLENIGIRIDDFEHGGIWKLRNNTIVNFPQEFFICAKNTIVEHHISDAKPKK